MSDEPASIPDDDLSRELTIARPGHRPEPHPHRSGRGHLHDPLRGEDTAGRYTLVDMHVPPNGGHADRQTVEMFTVLDGEVEATSETDRGPAGRGDHQRARERSALVHQHRQLDRRGCCACARPSGQEEFFTLVGQPVVDPNRTAGPAGPARPKTPSAPKRKPWLRASIYRVAAPARHCLVTGERRRRAPDEILRTGSGTPNPLILSGSRTRPWRLTSGFRPRLRTR